MNTELLSVVDKNDQVIETLTRDKIHSQGLPHRAVHILVFNSQGKFFLQKRSIKKDQNKGLWDTSAAGHVDAGEEYTDAAIREAKEELGINITKTLSFLFKIPPTKQLGMEFIKVYKCIHNGSFTLNTDEIETGTWLLTKEVSNRIHDNDPTLTETFKTIWRKYTK
ncbi:MAG: NUDIX domain-containing protein [Methylococcales bacterium]|nr:NUDIX domain-containing protein [Methylococcales bacterium]